MYKPQKAWKDGHCNTSPVKQGRSPASLNAIKVSEEKINDIRAHISKFPAESSHYSRNKNPNRKYLHCDLNISKMYDLYKQEVTEPVKMNTYRRVFNCDFNLGFGTPRSDTCATCDEFDANGGIESIAEHQADFELGYKMMSDDREHAKKTPGCNYLSFDLEKCMPLPRITTGIVYYKRQLNLYNMIIHLTNVKVDNGFMHLWTEPAAGRGGNEVASCLAAATEWCSIEPGELITWSDSCGGQNKNFTVLRMWQYLILKGTFTSITHKFPVVGHSWNDSDRDGGKIEQSLKTSGAIFDVDGYIERIRDAKKKNKFGTRKMDHSFINMDKLTKGLRLVKRTVNEEGDKIEFRDKVRQIRTTKFGYYQYKHSLNDAEQWKQVCLLPKTKAKVVNQPPPVVYLERQNRPIKAAKIENIAELMKFIPTPYQPFYTNLVAANDDDESDGVTDSDED